ncbi:hypothetical protein HMPREF2532_01297 [Bacteroides ovatus]|nr:hypothetical protein HMPREF2532_01297 [Bacteroides ovatus]
MVKYELIPSFYCFCNYQYLLLCIYVVTNVSYIYENEFQM